MEGGGSGSGLDGASMTTQSHNLISTSVALLVGQAGPEGRLDESARLPGAW